jgi:ribosomal protein L10
VPCVGALQEFVKTANKKDTHAPKYGVLESKALDAAAVEAISQLPTKTELYRRIAVGVNSVPQKIARGITVSVLLLLLLFFMLVLSSLMLVVLWLVL